MLAISSILVTLQFELVEYTTHFYLSVKHILIQVPSKQWDLDQYSSYCVQFVNHAETQSLGNQINF